MVLPRLRPWLKSAINIQHNAKQHLTKFASRLKTFRPLRRKWSKKSWSGSFGPQTSKLREGRGPGQIKVSVIFFELKREKEKHLSAYFPFALLRFKIVVWFRVRFTGEIWVLVWFGSEFIKVFRIMWRNKSSIFFNAKKTKVTFAQDS